MSDDAARELTPAERLELLQTIGSDYSVPAPRGEWDLSSVLGPVERLVNRLLSAGPEVMNDCTCAEPVPSGSLNRDAEVCLNCGSWVRRPIDAPDQVRDQTLRVLTPAVARLDPTHSQASLIRSVRDLVNGALLSRGRGSGQTTTRLMLARVILGDDR